MIARVRVRTVFLLLLAMSGLALVDCGGPHLRKAQPPGEVLFRANCQTCHVLPRPNQKTDDQWPELVERYGERAKLSADIRARILEYLLAVN